MSNTASPAGTSAGVRPSRATWIAFGFMVIFIGGNPVAVRFSDFGLPPFWGAALRFMGAAVVFWIVVAVRRLAVPRGRALLGAVLYGLFSVAAAFAFLYWGLQRIPANLSGAMLALVPLMTLFLAWAHRLEKLRWQGLVGALLAILGVVIGVVGGFGRTLYIPGLLAIVAGVACLAEGSVVFKLFPSSNPAVTNAVAFTISTPILLILSALTSEKWSLPSSPTTWAAYAYLVLIGSVAVFSLYLYILSRWTATATSYSFLLTPVATFLIAAWLLREPITLSFGIGLVLVLLGVWLGAIRSSRKTAELVCAEVPNKALC